MLRFVLLLMSLFLLTAGSWLYAGPPQSFMALYDAGFGKFKAQSARSFEYQEPSQLYLMRSETRLTLLGGTLSSIEENSTLRWENDQPVPLAYQYIQKGLGSRERSAQFDHAANTLAWTEDEKSGQLMLSGQVFDDLSVFLALREQLMAGRTTLLVDVLDKSVIKAYHYEVTGTQTLDTAVGSFQTVHITRIRDAGSTRTTEFWLAPELDYLLLRLRQSEPDGRDIKLDIREIQPAPAGSTE